MAISPQRLTIYLYSAHRAVIFAIAQLSCLDLSSIPYFTACTNMNGTILPNCADMPLKICSLTNSCHDNRWLKRQFHMLLAKR